MSAGTLGKNIQNQTGSIQYPALQFGFKIAFLAGREIVVEYNQFGVTASDSAGYFVQLACANKKFGVGGLARPGQKLDRITTCRYH
jgi:hypothetical protein